MFMLINNQGQRHVCPLNTTEQDTNYEHYLVPLGFIPIDHVKAAFRDTTQLVSKFLCLPIRQHFKYRFTRLYFPRLTEKYSTYTFFYSKNVIGGGWCDHVFCGKKYLFWDFYGMSTQIQGGENLDTFISDYGSPTHILS